MKVADIAMLKDLKRSHNLLSRRMKGKKKSKHQPRVVVRRSIQLHNGSLGMVSPETLIREADWACRFLMLGHKMLAQRDLEQAIDAYFKAAAIATNIVFSSNVNNMRLPEKVYDDMNCIIHEATRGMKSIMKVIAVKKVTIHEREQHGKKPVERKVAGRLSDLMAKLARRKMARKRKKK